MTHDRDRHSDDAAQAGRGTTFGVEYESAAQRKGIRGEAFGCLYSGLVLGVAVVVGGLLAFERPDRKGWIPALWAAGLLVVVLVTVLLHRRGTSGVVKGVLFGIGISALAAGMCYSGN